MLSCMSLSRITLLAVLLGAVTGMAEASAGAEESPSVGPRHAVALGLGLRADTVREDLVVPLTFSGPGLRLMVGYRGLVGPGALAINADVGMALLWNRFGHPAATLDHDADAAWTVPVRRTSISHWALGPMLGLDSHFNFLFSWDNAHAYWLAAQWLGPALGYGRRLTEAWRLESRAGLALVGFVGRPPSYRYRKQETRPSVSYPITQPYGSESFVSLADLQVVRVDVALRRVPYTGSDVARGWSFGLDARFARAGRPATAINMGVCFYAARAWGLR
jgi:hypothetical protein